MLDHTTPLQSSFCSGRVSYAKLLFRCVLDWLGFSTDKMYNAHIVETDAGLSLKRKESCFENLTALIRYYSNTTQGDLPHHLIN